jgi:hypothetical protein
MRVNYKTNNPLKKKYRIRLYRLFRYELTGYYFFFSLRNGDNIYLNTIDLEYKTVCQMRLISSKQEDKSPDDYQYIYLYDHYHNDSHAVSRLDPKDISYKYSGKIFAMMQPRIERKELDILPV